MRKPNDTKPNEKTACTRSATQLLIETCDILKREDVFHKRSRWLFTYKIADIVNDFHTSVIEANETKVLCHRDFVDRHVWFTRAQAHLRALSAKMTVAQLVENIPVKHFEKWAGLWNDAWDSLLKQMNSDTKRYSEQFGELSAGEVIAREEELIADGK